MDRLFTDAERRSDASTALLQAASLGVGAVHELGGPHLGPIEDLIRVREAADELGIGLVCYWGELASTDVLAKGRSVGAAGLAGDLCIDGFHSAQIAWRGVRSKVSMNVLSPRYRKCRTYCDALDQKVGKRPLGLFA